MSASIVRVCSSKPLVDSNTVLFFKAISNMSCLTSFKSYLTPRNSHEFTVRIKEANSQRGRNYHFHFVLLCSAKGTWKGCLPRDEYISPHLQHNAFQWHKRLLKKFTFYFNCCHYGWGNEREVQSLRMTGCWVLGGTADVSGDQAQRSTWALSVMDVNLHLYHYPLLLSAL